MAKTSFISKFNIVRQVPAFSKLSWFETAQIALKSFFADYRKGDMIRLEGDAPDFFYCVISGRLQSYTKNYLGHKEHIEYLHRGMYFGIVSLLTGENHSHNFEAMNDSVILQIPRSDFQSLLEAIPKLAIELSQTLSQNVRKNVKGIKTTHQSTIISIYSPVKGSGSSTYAINLALALQRETKKKVVLTRIHSVESGRIDQDIKTDASPQWKMPMVYWHEIMDDYNKVLQKVLKEELPIGILNAAFDLTQMTEASLKKEISPFVSVLVNDYDYVIVDLPNDMDDVVLEALAQSDKVHLLTTDQKEDLDLMKQSIQRLRPVLKGDFHQGKVKVIVRSASNKVYFSFEEMDQILGYDISRMIPNIQDSDLGECLKTSSLSFCPCLSNSSYSQEIKHIAREIGEVLVGLVLGGGAALGVAHIGVLQVLEEENIPVDIVVGSSMGALIGAFWCAGFKAQEIEKVAREFEKKMNMIKLLDPVFPISGFIGGRAIQQWLKKYLSQKTFYSLKIPLKVVAYDLVHRKDMIIENGSLVEAVRRSISIPGVIEPIKEKDKVIIDGGVLNPLPTNVLVDKGIQRIIAVNVLQSPEDVSKGVSLIEQKEKMKEQIPFRQAPLEYIKYRILKRIRMIFNPTLSDIIVQTLQSTEYVIAEQSAKQAQVAIHPNLVGIDWYELDRVNELIKAGQEAAKVVLPKMKKLITPGVSI
ncbi:MAG TPA: patatin-like phospholipase family protein [Candidatus Omnitrophota bacterium]|nr:patatin-like phospholipase family protein [Candidatus Omnitrophota bacterium]